MNTGAKFQSSHNITNIISGKKKIPKQHEVKKKNLNVIIFSLILVKLGTGK